MILSAFLARIREISSNRGVVSAVSSFAVVFGSAQGYCQVWENKDNTIQIRARIDRGRFGAYRQELMQPRKHVHSNGSRDEYYKYTSHG